MLLRSVAFPVLGAMAVHSGSIKTYTGAREKLGFGLMTSDWANSSWMWSRDDPNEHIDTSSIDGLDVYSTYIAVRKSRFCTSYGR